MRPEEYRDISLNGALSQLHMDMSGRHQARHDTIHIVRTSIVKKGDQIRRPQCQVYRDAKIAFPVTKYLVRSGERKYRTNFKARRPTTVRK